jgi:hypothetical protein
MQALNSLANKKVPFPERKGTFKQLSYSPKLWMLLQAMLT